MSGQPEPRRDALIPAEADRPMIAFFDVDNTLMRGTSSFAAGVEAGRKRLITVRQLLPFVWHQVQFMRNGEHLGRMSSARERALGLLAGITTDDVIEVVEAGWTARIAPKLWPETVELARAHLAAGHQVWLMSATPQEIGEVMARRLGLTGAICTRLQTKDGVYTGELDGPFLHAEQKAVAAKELADQTGASLADCWAYSDSVHDVPLLSAVGHPTAVNPDARLLIHAHGAGWPVLRLHRKSIKASRKQAKRDARG